MNDVAVWETKQVEVRQIEWPRPVVITDEAVERTGVSAEELFARVHKGVSRVLSGRARAHGLIISLAQLEYEYDAPQRRWLGYIWFGQAKDAGIPGGLILAPGTDRVTMVGNLEVNYDASLREKEVSLDHQVGS